MRQWQGYAQREEASLGRVVHRIPLTDEYERAISETMASAKGDNEAIIAGTERLAALQKRYEQVRNSFPTWSIEIVQLRRLPLLLSLLPSFLNVLTKK